MKIGFDARLISSLGIGRYISGLLPHLAEILRERLVVISRPAELALVRALTAGQGQLLVSDAAPYRLAEQSTFLTTVIRAGAAVMHFPHYNLPLAYPRPFVVTIHDLFSFRYPEIHSGLLPRFANQLLIKNAARRSAAIITPSRTTADEVAQRFPSAGARIQPVAEAAGARFSPVRNPAAEVAWQRYFGIRPPYFFYLGQWKPYKNVPLLIEAFSQVVAQRPEVQLVIAGQDPRYPDVTAARARLPAGSLILPGHLPDDAVADLYRGAVAVVMPSRAEGFGLPVLEAMACGVTVVCSNIPVLRELAEGVAIFCDPESADAFAAGMLTALSPTPDDDRARRGIERARQFSWRKAAEETTAIYERVLAGRPRTRSDIH
ncbi:MAG TPA: glycosyltransferase family 1 protein [Candidatus Dormibacteraeota bacterium]|nr:glycosyltransferase family 1 protein [Candidatus Dormibacteraeota bacterium]